MVWQRTLSRRSYRRLLLKQKGRCVTKAFFARANAKFAAAAADDDDDNLGAERISEISRRSSERARAGMRAHQQERAQEAKNEGRFGRRQTGCHEVRWKSKRRTADLIFDLYYRQIREIFHGFCGKPPCRAVAAVKGI